MEGNLENNQAMYMLKGKVVAIPLRDETLTKAGYYADAKVVGDALAIRLKKNSVVDNLMSDLTDAPLSARQGKVIKEMLDDSKTSGAGGVGYNNSESGLEADNMQSAIDEVAKIANDALPMDGSGMVTGAVKFQNEENGHGAVCKNNSANADYGTQLEDVLKDGSAAKLTVSAITGLTFTDKEGNTHNIAHEGNKAFGQYIGDGSASPRTIDTKSIGKMLMVYSATRLSFVTPKGSLTINITSGDIGWIDGEKVYYLNGKLNLETPGAAFNDNGTTYYYQAI